MSYLTQFQGVTRALELKAAMQEVNARALGTSITTKTGIEMAGLGDFIKKGEDIKLPIFNQNGDRFAAKFLIDPNIALKISGKVKEGAIIQYGDEIDQSFGIVIEPPASSKKVGVYVKPLNKEQVDKLMLENPNIPKFHIKKGSADKIEEVNIGSNTQLPKFLLFLDPIQKIMFHFYKEALLRLLAIDRKILVDTMLWLYILLIILVLIVIVIVYI